MISEVVLVTKSGREAMRLVHFDDSPEPADLEKMAQESVKNKLARKTLVLARTYVA